jgi:hypothetical protein
MPFLVTCMVDLLVAGDSSPVTPPLGTLPVSVKTRRIALCPKSPVGSNMHGQAAVDHRDAVRPAVLRGGLGDAARARAHDASTRADSELGAFAHRLLGDLRPRPDHDRLDAAGDRAEVVIREITLHRLRVGIDGEHLVAAIPQALVDDIAPVVALSRKRR